MCWLLLVPMSWMVFVIGDLKSLREMLQVMCFIPLKGSMAPGILDGMAALRPYIWVLALGILFATPYPEKLRRKYIHTWPVRLLMLGLFWFSVWQIYKSGSSPFLYLAF